MSKINASKVQLVRVKKVNYISLQTLKKCEKAVPHFFLLLLFFD